MATQFHMLSHELLNNTLFVKHLSKLRSALQEKKRSMQYKQMHVKVSLDRERTLLLLFKREIVQLGAKQTKVRQRYYEQGPYISILVYYRPVCTGVLSANK